MNNNPATLSRRAVAKGAAWSVPAVSLAAATPALAASATYTAQMGMFNTVQANGYGYDSIDGPAGPIQQGFQQGTLSGNDQNWSDSTAYPTVKAGYPGARSNVINLQGDYTPGGTGGSVYGQNYYGSGMWLSSPVDAAGNPVAGTTTLAAGATFQNCIKIVGVRSSDVQAPSGYTQTTSLTKDFGSTNYDNGTRRHVNGVSETLSPSTWTVSGPDAQGLYTGTGCITFTTNGDLVISSTGTIQYTQLALTPGLQTSSGLGNGIMLYCSTVSFLSGSITTTVDGQSTTVPAETTATQLDPTTSFVRAQYDQSVKRWGGGTTAYTGLC